MKKKPSDKTIRMRYRLMRFVDKYDALWDYIICGCPLTRYVPSKYRETKGATGSQSTRYWILDKMFQGQSFSKDDVFIDVGCGKGRVIAYLIKKKFPGKIKGIELNEEVAQYCKEWAKKYPDIEIISGDAFEYSFQDITVMFLGRPFLPEMFHRFVDKIESEAQSPITFYYWVDQQSGDYLNDRPGWTMKTRKTIFKKLGIIFLCPTPQRYSIWTYTPSQKK